LIIFVTSRQDLPHLSNIQLISCTLFPSPYKATCVGIKFRELFA